MVEAQHADAVVPPAELHVETVERARVLEHELIRVRLGAGAGLPVHDGRSLSGTAAPVPAERFAASISRVSSSASAMFSSAFVSS
ncbi:hypothetical protein PM3016_6399 [Paenibacillus mucilaginosus 3016]|uniref:Uncharacterized protein n=1 Tax=Paenibacillus mucilaginosus 3016 TaxID=1116391 RepID=H6NGE9_9BACL|nr:hypothetical protein PM3016_6399 [Paenibacillus mucilaginosus 3016]